VKCDKCDQMAVVKLTPCTTATVKLTSCMTRDEILKDINILDKPIHLCLIHFAALGPITTTHVWNEKLGRFEPAEDKPEDKS
jgi:hypothetical protein